MKKLQATALLLVTCFALQAQEPNANNFDPFRDREFLFDVLHISTSILMIYIVASFIKYIIKISLDQRIKNRVIDKGIPENIAAQVLQPDKTDNRSVILQWICILVSIGAGLTLITFFRPYGIHTIAIMAFSIALGFLVFYLAVKKTAAQQS